jgi:class 3 adenylate cyclase/tetratricopeptide (TPR) repeat protein
MRFHCSGCGSEYEAGARFCRRCGARLPAACAACGRPLEPDAIFCSGCGGRVDPAPGQSAAAPDAAPAAPAITTERRLVSVLFADLVGFTELSDGRDAEETRELLSRYVALARTIAARYGGTIEKFIGDAVMTVWGAPIANEDDAELAVRAGLDLVDAVATLGAGIRARAAVMTGEAAVAVGAVGEGLVAGDLVNTAARLQSAAEPGSVLVGEATYRAASRAVAFEPAGEHRFRGKSAPLRAWRALHVVAERGGRNRGDGLEPLFVGRGAELRQCKELLEAVCRDGGSHLLAIVGPGGIGKSRLAWELRKYVDGLVEDVWWHEGRCPSWGDGAAFVPLAQMFRSRAGIDETDEVAAARGKVAAMLEAHVPDAVEREWIGASLLPVLGLGPATIPAEEQFAAWGSLFAAMARVSPVVLLFEDLELADEDLLDFIDLLLDRNRTAPILLVALTRPELLERRPDWTLGKRRLTSITLDPLEGSAMATLLAGLAPELPGTLARTIVERAEGIPLYAMEMVRTLVADGRLVAEAGALRPAGDWAGMTGIAVPETLVALIAARLDGLPRSLRAVVDDAAVLGGEFALAALAALSGIEMPELGLRLRQLVRREILVLADEPRGSSGGRYAFVQGLIREVAYNTLSRAERKRRHLAAAAHFESMASPEQAGVVAGHLLAAYGYAGSVEAAELAPAARAAARVAAERAIELGAIEQALVLLRRALEIPGDAAEQAALLEMAGVNATVAARYEEAELDLRTAIEAYRTLGDRRGAARTIAAFGRTLIHAYRIDAALELLLPALAEFADLGRDPGYLYLRGQLARGLFLRYSFDEAIAIADAALAAGGSDLDPAVAADLLITRGSARHESGLRAEGIEDISQGIALAESNHRTEEALRGRLNLGCFVAPTDLAAACRNDRAGLAQSDRAGSKVWALLFTYNLAEESFWLGGWSRNVAEVGALLGTGLEREDWIQGLTILDALEEWRGRPDEARRREIDALSGETLDPEVETSVQFHSARVAFAGDDLGEAVATAITAAEATHLNAPEFFSQAARAAVLSGDTAAARDLVGRLRSASDGPIVEARAHSIEAGIAALDGDAGRATHLYESALNELHDLGLLVDEAFTGIEMAGLLDPELPAVAAAAERARQILGELEAAPFLARLEARLARRPDPVA